MLQFVEAYVANNFWIFQGGTNPKDKAEATGNSGFMASFITIDILYKEKYKYY